MIIILIYIYNVAIYPLQVESFSNHHTQSHNDELDCLVHRPQYHQKASFGLGGNLLLVKA